jgi:serine/threonine protein kinase
MRTTGGPSEASTRVSDSFVLIDIVKAALGRRGGELWTVRPTDAWCYVTPPEKGSRDHGWKLHLTATPLSAPLVLARAADVLTRHNCPFKFATDMRRVTELVSDWYDRGGSGKFVTVYPRDDEQFRELAHELDSATDGLVGPQILSDRQLRPGSLVHYRYGALSVKQVFTNDGVFESRMVSPDGDHVRDERHPWFAPPAWAPSAFPDCPVTTASTPDSVLLIDRFRVTGVIRYANKGGVYRAVDESDGAEVIIKQARAHVGAELDGTDVRDRLTDEARMLDALMPLAIAPAKVALFDQQEDLFLAQELVPGVSLFQWATERTSSGTVNVAEATAMIRRLELLMRTIHQAGFVIRDFKPQNVMVLPSGEVRLIDVEHVAELGQIRKTAVTPGFAAPELTAEPKRRAMPVLGQSYDCFSLGVTIFVMITALPPAWVSAGPSGRLARDELRQLLKRIATSHPALAVFVDLIVGLTHSEPDDRWSLKQVLDFVTALETCDDVLAQRPATMTLPGESLERLLTSGLAHLKRSINLGAPTLWKSNDPRSQDACSAWPGAAGVLATLTRAAQVTDNPSLRESVAGVAAWIDRRLFDIPRLLPGLSFGRSGTSWALFDAAELLGDERLASRAIELAKRLPTRWHSPDITHGLSGAGMAHLHLWRRSREEDLHRRAVAYADGVLTGAHRSGEDWFWPTGTDNDSAVAGSNALGFAHGVAGTGAFLLAVGESMGSDETQDARGVRFRTAALGAGDTLLRAARIVDGAALWPTSVGGDDQALRPWCSGSAGIGAFLIRLWLATGQARFATLAEQAAEAVTRNPWKADVSACCGLAGAGHFLLDMSEATGRDQFRGQAEELAYVIHAQRRVKDGLEIVAKPDQIDYAAGSSGVLAFLLRLRHGGPAPWMPPISPNVTTDRVVAKRVPIRVPTSMP